MEVVSVRVRLTAATGDFDFDQLAERDDETNTDVERRREAYLATASVSAVTRTLLACSASAVNPLPDPSLSRSSIPPWLYRQLGLLMWTTSAISDWLVRI